MTLAQMKEQIVTVLHDSFSAYELPNVCLELGLSPGTASEAMKSKYVYTRTRISGKSRDYVLEILPKIKELTGAELIPEKKYSYEISNVTRKEIAKILSAGIADPDDFYEFGIIYKIRWNGDISEIDFLKKLCDISTIPVLDTRCRSFEEELYRHRIQNDDWPDDYFFLDERLPFKKASTDQLLHIICWIFHPEVRDESGCWDKVKNAIGDAIRHDGFEFFEKSVISERPVFGIRRITFLEEADVYQSGLEKIRDTIDSEYIRKEVKQAIDSACSDSYYTIGKAKELVETTCKYILDNMCISYEGLNFGALTKKTRKELRIEKTDYNKEIPGVLKILVGLNSVVDGMAELRNEYGSGHGRDSKFRTLPLRYGKLAISAASSYIEFLLCSFEDYKKREIQTGD